jgi:Cys-tRNA(Pro)/Cys-tRNA(Cys) deacylase
MQKTLAMKLLEGKKIPYEPFTYPTTERDAAVIATHFGVDPALVYKTLVVDRPAPQKPLLVLVAANRQLDLAKLARVTGDKKLKMATHGRAEELTGLQVGGISPLALLNQGFQVYLDDPARQLSHIFISAGQRGINLKVPVEPVAKLIRARYADVGTDEG